MKNNAVILIFAKAPTPGKVKTRLIPALGEAGAAMLHVALVERALNTASATNIDVVLCATPDSTAPFFQDLADDFDVDIAQQSAVENLGARMLHSLDEALENYAHVILIGADCPAFTAAHLLTVLAQLAAHDVVITPAEDGGYTLIAVNKTAPNMFANILWSTENVMEEQRVALRNAGLTWAETSTLWDVDRAEDLARLNSLRPPFDFQLPP